MNKPIFCLIVMLSFANCTSNDDCRSDLENVNAECIFKTQESLYMCCYSSQREIVNLPTYVCRPDIDSASYDDVKYLGFFEPLESTFKMLPSMEEGRNFIFQNQLGEHLTLNYKHLDIRIGSSESELHSSGNITLLCQETLRYEILVSSEELDYIMNISISTKVSYLGDIIYLNDFLVLRKSDSLGVFRSWPGHQLKLTLDKRNSLEDHLYSSDTVHFDEIDLNDIIFQNIYTNSSSSHNGNEPLNTFYFSYDYGLVGIKDEFDNLWVLNKIE
ncbi:MAG: hypothetical protein IPM42_00335 [Saprospiraceae bacterium]|nr:hypothetical protein [Saprospiraceae bacterium]